MPELTDTPVVTCFLRHRGEVLLLLRSDEVGSYSGRWGAVSGHIEEGGDRDAAAWQEIEEETGLSGEDVTLVRSGAAIHVEDEALGTRWIIHPYLFDCRHRKVELDWESAEDEWVHPTEMLHRETVPELWASYVQVAPSVASIRDERLHGAAYLSIRALEVLRDWAGRLAWQQVRGELPADRASATLRALAEELLAARPSMAVVRNRINRVMHATPEAEAQAVERAAREAIADAYEADEETARRAARLVAGRRVLTFSRSSTVLDALKQAHPAPTIFVAESRPGGEGVTVAEELARGGRDVTLLPDAALAHVILEHDIEIILTGADTVLPDGRVVNKTGTRIAALAAREQGVPLYATCACDKVSASAQVEMEEHAAVAFYDGDAPLQLLNPLFELTPADLVAGIVTESGVLTPEAMREVAEELQELEDW